MTGFFRRSMCWSGERSSYRSGMSTPEPVTAWRAGGTSPRNMPAFAALIVGVLMVLIFLGFVIAGE